MYPPPSCRSQGSLPPPRRISPTLHKTIVGPASNEYRTPDRASPSKEYRTPDKAFPSKEYRKKTLKNDRPMQIDASTCYRASYHDYERKGILCPQIYDFTSGAPMPKKARYAKPPGTEGRRLERDATDGVGMAC